MHTWLLAFLFFAVNALSTPARQSYLCRVGSSAAPVTRGCCYRPERGANTERWMSLAYVAESSSEKAALTLKVRLSNSTAESSLPSGAVYLSGVPLPLLAGNFSPELVSWAPLISPER